uniref:Uncharacterized protein n=1 Tax=Oryzias melastigma TaxID=30732 RepID=A0A3B3CE65_ORYME
MTYKAQGEVTFLDVRKAERGKKSTRCRFQMSPLSYAHLDASRATFAHSIGHSGAWGVNHGHEPHKAKVVGMEVDIICVESKAFWVFVLWHEQVAETCKKGDKRQSLKLQEHVS